MSGLILSILPLAAGAAVSPTVLIVGLSLVASPQGATRRLIAFTAGAATVLVALSALSLALAHRTGGIHTTPDEVGTVQLVVAALLIALGVRSVLRPPAPPRERPRETGTRGCGGRCCSAPGSCRRTSSRFACRSPRST